MNKIILKLPLFKEMDIHEMHGSFVEHNGLDWWLEGLQVYDDDAIDEKQEILFVRCQPNDRNMLFRCEVDITYKNGDEKETAGTFMINHHTIGEVERSKQFYASYSDLNFENQYIAEIAIKAFEIIPKNNFDFKDPALTDIALIIGGKTLYTNKHTLALYSKKFYEMIYGSDKEVRQIKIKDVDYRTFHSFLEMMHGFDRGRVSEKMLDFTRLALRYDSKQSLDHCEASYLYSLRDTRGNHEPIRTVGKFQAAQDHLTNVYKKAMRAVDTPLRLARRDDPIPMTKIPLSARKTTIVFEVEGIPFKITVGPYRGMYKLEMECIYEDASELWECEVMMREMDNYRTPERNFYFKTGRKDSTVFSWFLNDTSKAIYLGIKAFSDPYPDYNIDFSHPRDNLTDVVLSVGDKKYHVSKQILANASSYFYSLFYANSAEKEDEVELENVGQAEFEEFLQHFYYPRRFVKDTTLESLLRLSTYYNVQFIHQNCIRWILFDMRATNAQMMVLAAKHNLDSVFNNLAARIETVENFIAFSKLDGFDELEEKTIAMIKPKEKNSLKRKLEADPSST